MKNQQTQAKYVTQGESIYSCLNNISLACLGIRESAGNFQWRYSKYGNENIAPYKIKGNNSKRVNQYDLNGIFIKTWDSALQASIELSVNDIGMCCNNKIDKAGGFQWRFTDEVLKGNINKYIRKTKVGEKNSRFGKFGKLTHNSKKINQYTINGEFIKSFDSIMGAAKELSITANSISLCCRGLLKSYGGFTWKYA